MSNMNNLDINSRKNKQVTNEINEINFLKRTIDNYTHEDISDKKIKKITSWRKSQKKFLSVLILNLITFGLLHLISKSYPKLYLKLYCNICHPKYSDFFLVEDIYGNCKLCQSKKTKKNLSLRELQNRGIDVSSKAYISLFPSWNSNNLNIKLTNDNTHSGNDQYIYINNNPIISFLYNSKIYEYDEIRQAITPVFLNLAGKTNKNIIDIFSEGLSSQYLVKKIEERYGKNEYKLNVDLINLYYNKVEKRLLIYSVICGILEIFVRDGFSTLLLLIIIIFYYIFRKIFLHKQLKHYNCNDFTIDGEKSYKPKAKRKYLFNIKNDTKIKRKSYEKKEIRDKYEDTYQDIKSKNTSTNISNNNKINSNNDKFIEEEENDEYNFQYVEINNNELLPGDVIYLKEGDYVPCDGIILENDCIVNEIEVNETLENYNKTFLKYTNDIFDYKGNKNNILLHGMKIVNIFRKNGFNNNNNRKFITVLCINTGSNTYKANQITNVTDLLERKENYNKMYKLFSGQRLLFIIFVTVIFLITLIIPTIMIIFKIKKEGYSSIIVESFVMNNNSFSPFSGPTPSKPQSGGVSPHDESMKKIEELKSQSNSEEIQKQIRKKLMFNYFLNYFLRVLIKSYMPIYYVITLILMLLGIYRLYNINIFCYEKMRLRYAGEIDTIFMSKINILSDDNYEIEGYHPAFQSSKVSNITFQTYYEEQLKDFGTVIFSYYNNIKNRKGNSVGLENINLVNRTSGKYSVWFLECLLCCNNLIKIGQDIQGSSIEKKLFDRMKWEFKIVENENNLINDDSHFIQITENSTIYNNSSNECFSAQSEEDSINNKLFYYGCDKEIKFIYNRITDLFPQNYYRMSDKRNLSYQKLISRFKFYLSKKILKKKDSKRKTFNYADKRNDSSKINKNNTIIKDISNIKFGSYKLRIYKKFITKNSLFSSAIVYNFLLKTLRFMTKGSPEKILPHCLISSLPVDICKTISNFRKEGYIIIICASKKIDLYSYNDSKDESYYMKDLMFCGFITLKNKIKKESRKAINELQKMKCQIMMNTGDNVYNSVGTGFEIGLLDNKKIYVFDFDDNKKQIYINNIYRPTSFDYEILEKIEEKKRAIRSKKSKFIKKMKKIDLSTIKKIREDNYNYHSKSPTNLNGNYGTNLKNNLNGIKNVPTFSQYKFLRFSKNRASNNNFLSNTNSKLISNDTANNNDSIFSSERSPALSNCPTIKNNEIESKKNESSYKINKLIKENNKNSKSIGNKNLNSNFVSPKSNKKSNKDTPSQISIDNREINKTKNESPNSNNILEKKLSLENSKKNLSYTHTFSEIENEDFDKEEFIKEYFSNMSYLSSSMLKNLENNCIFCVSGKAFQFIYENKNTAYYSNLLNNLSKNTKIFFSMTSQDKSLLIDYFSELPNKTTCMIGYGTSDIDSIMTSHVGITIKKPNNANMMLCHFYLSSKNIMNVKTIIKHGRVILENFFLLFISCIFCTSIINLYMAFSYYILLEIRPSSLAIFNLNFFILSLLGFTSSIDDNSYNYLMQNNQLFWKYIISHIIGNVIIKGYDVIIFSILYRKNSKIEENRRNRIYISYFSILALNLIFTTLFGFNFIRFYRRNIYDNFWLCIAFIIFFLMILIITCLSRTGFATGLTRFFTFENLKSIGDTFDDRNKLMMFIIIAVDLASCILYISLLQYYFNKKAEEVSKKNKKVN